MGNIIMYKLAYVVKNGTMVTGYGLVDSETGMPKIYNREQVAFLAGRKQIIGLASQISNGAVIYKGTKIPLKNLPVKQQAAPNRATVTDSQDKAYAATPGARGRKSLSANGRYMIFGTVRSKDNKHITEGYKVVDRKTSDAGVLSKEQVVKLISQNQVVNARVQVWNGRTIIRLKKW